MQFGKNKKNKKEVGFSYLKILQVVSLSCVNDTLSKFNRRIYLVIAIFRAYNDFLHLIGCITNN